MWPVAAKLSRPRTLVITGSSTGQHYKVRGGWAAGSPRPVGVTASRLQSRTVGWCTAKGALYLPTAGPSSGARLHTPPPQSRNINHLELRRKQHANSCPKPTTCSFTNLSYEAPVCWAVLWAWAQGGQHWPESLPSQTTAWIFEPL